MHLCLHSVSSCCNMSHMNDELITIRVPASAKTKYPDLERRLRGLRRPGVEHQRQLWAVLSNLRSTDDDGHEITSRELDNA